MKTRMNLTIGAAATLVALAGATVSAVDFDPTFQGGQYDTTQAASVARGDGGNFEAVRITVPMLLPASQSIFNTSVIQADPTDSSRPLAGVTSFSGTATNAKFIAALGTSDMDFPMGSNNVFLAEGSANRSNSFGVMLPDGTGVWRENIDFQSQNNIGYSSMMVEPQTAALTTTADLVFGSSFNGIGDGSTLNGGSVFLGTPGAARDAAGNLLVGNTNFDAFTGDIVSGTNIFNAGTTSGSVNPAAPSVSWPQSAVVGMLLPTGEDNGGVRQTQPLVQSVVSPDTGTSQVLACFGVGISGGTITGGAAEPRYFVIDSAEINDGFAGALFIEADGAGSTDLMGSDIANTDANMYFVDHQATGGGGGPFVNGQFDMNANGDIAALWANETVTPTVFEIRVYKANWSGDTLTGYDAPVTIASAGADGIENNVQDNGFELVPMTGPSIDNMGRVSFIGITEAIYDPAAPMGMPDLIGSTNTVFVYNPSSDTLHGVLSGGANGDVLADADMMDATGGNLSLEIGTIPIDPQGTSDAFSRSNMSDEGGFIAVNFRNGLENDPAFGGGVLFDPNMADDTTDASVRGVAVIELGEFTVMDTTCFGDCDDSGAVNFADLVSMLFEFGGPGSIDGCDADESGVVNFSDLVSALFLFGPCP